MSKLTNEQALALTIKMAEGNCTPAEKELVIAHYKAQGGVVKTEAEPMVVEYDPTWVPPKSKTGEAVPLVRVANHPGSPKGWSMGEKKFDGWLEGIARSDYGRRKMAAALIQHATAAEIKSFFTLVKTAFQAAKKVA